MTDITIPLDPNAQNKLNASANVLLQTLLPLSAQDLTTWMAANVTNFTQVQAVLCALMLAVQTDVTGI